MSGEGEVTSEMTTEMEAALAEMMAEVEAAMGDAGEVEITVRVDQDGRAATAEVKTRVSNPQAANMMRSAQTQRRMLPRSACNTCDEVMARYPDSLEAEEAKVFIKDVLRRDARLRREREREGKYTGY